jgi:tetratricopeptide (TPR) repeat protein
MLLRLLPILLASALGLACPAQVPLAEVAKLARERAERSRPAQQAALEPFWADLQLDYRINQQHLDQKIAEVAALGDSVVPLLLEKLQPAQGGDTARHLAGNCRRVLEKLDPGSFLDALVELANSRNDVARSEAIRLLGLAPAAAPILTDLLDRTAGEEKRLVVRSLRQLKATAAAPKVVGMLGSGDRQLREEVLAFLVAARAGQVVDVVVQALANERDNNLLPWYVEYFGAAVKANDAAARALLPLLDRDRLNWADARRLVQALATVAPHEHEPTIRRLQQILDEGDTSSLAVQAAVTLRALGDRQGVTKLKRTLDEQLRKPSRRREAALYETRANLLFAVDEYAEAFADYEKVLEYQDGMAMARRAYIGQMRCEARRKKTQNLLRLMKQSGFLVAEIEAIGQDDPVFAETLQQDRVRAFLRDLAKEQTAR